MKSFSLKRRSHYVIAEIGGNHEGSIAKAKTMIRKAAKAGADAVKFQVFKADRIVASNSKKPAYSGISHKQQAARFKGLEFTIKQYESLAQLAKNVNVDFMASVFDERSADEIDHLLSAYKVASGDLTHYPLLKHLQRKKKPIILSTGASTIKDIDEVVQFLGRQDLALLHCICAYPAPYSEINLKTIPLLKKRFSIPIGYSDHSIGNQCALAAAALGSCITEKHFTLDTSIKIGDHKLSATPETLAQLVGDLRIITSALGESGRKLMPCERRSQKLVRRSLYLTKDIQKGQIIEPNNIAALRPLEGIEANMSQSVVGKKAKKNLKKHSSLRRSDV